MRQILALCAFMLFALPIAAQETIPYDQMSYEQLKEVNQKALSKTDKKAFKKAYKKAQKRWKKAERARKKAEKARIRAEKKRQKAIAKRLKKVNKYYANTIIKYDEFTTKYKIEGKIIKPKADWDNLFFTTMRGPAIALAADVDPDASTSFVGLAIATHTSISGINTARLDYAGKSIRTYLREEGYWNNYNKALLKGGKERIANTQSQDIIGECTIEKCEIMEMTGVLLNLEDLTQAIEQRTNLAVRLSASNAPNLVAEIPYAYMVGYLLRYAEIDSRFSEYRRIAEEARNHIASGR